MSYIRFGSEYKFVKGESKDYIYPTKNKKGKTIVHDFGSISNKTLVELLCRYAYIEDPLLPHVNLKGYLINKLAEKLNVKLRKKVIK